MEPISLSVISFLNELGLICLRTIISIVSTQLSDFNYCNLTFTILFIINQWNSYKYFNLTPIILFNIIYLYVHV